MSNQQLRLWETPEDSTTDLCDHEHKNWQDGNCDDCGKPLSTDDLANYLKERYGNCLIRDIKSIHFL